MTDVTEIKVYLMMYVSFSHLSFHICYIPPHFPHNPPHPHPQVSCHHSLYPGN